MNEPARILVLLNQHSGTLDASGTGGEGAQITEQFAERGVKADVRAVQVDDIDRTVAAAAQDGYVAVVAGGGDGTINAVVNATVGTRLAFGVIPLGTHNHFAKDLGIPTDCKLAVNVLADALQAGQVRPMDLAEVNGHLFLNFSGIGLHPKVIRRREEDHEQIKRWRWLRAILQQFTKPLAFLLSFIRSLSDFPVHRLTMTTEDGSRRVRVTPAVIVCTNVHQMEVFGVTELSVPRRGVLNTYIACTPRITGLVRLLLAALTRRLKALREFESLASDTLTISTRRKTLHVSIDGEIVRLQTPLRYRIRRDALRVIGGTIQE